METGLISFVSNEQGFNCISSVVVAERFNRQHKDVLRVIDTLIVDEELEIGVNFTPIFYQDDYKRDQPAKLLTDIGFAILISSFNLKDPEDKKLQKEIKKTFRDKLQAQLEELKSLRILIPQGKMVKGPHGTKYQPNVAKENKVIAVTDEASEIIGIEKGEVNANELTATQLLICMISSGESRMSGIEKNLEKKRKYLAAIEAWILNGKRGEAPLPKEYGVTSEYNDILVSNMD